MSSKRAKAKTTKKRPQRATSNVFAMFDQSQIQEFKEAFNMIDQNRDGFIDKEDLHDMLASLGKNPTDEYLEGMMSEAPGPINFTMFLTMFGEKLNGTDPEDVIRNAFACFDEEASGFIHEDHLRELLTTMGDRFTDEEVDEMYREDYIFQLYLRPFYSSQDPLDLFSSTYVQKKKYQGQEKAVKLLFHDKNIFPVPEVFPNKVLIR
ncbi:PREDICTED: myosin regulatory light polypeptide 9 [Elephantulus edwardii]|uniref:myosin regulatory light polypeptide 9 n=1 Tax=Elephantulus edwardii TaxID=28737 RepID=UPI0003F0B991|nr:PREDICTED: myosin regulatory light polypeptide 9 [Elephantulus edwardii]